MITDYIAHEEAVIQHFMEDPDFADLYLETVKADGDADEIAEVQSWYNEAQARSYWKSLIDNAEHTAATGRNLESVIELMNKALGILQAAVTARA